MNTGTSYAVVIGIDEYKDGIPALRGAVTDATEVGRVLRGKHGYRVTELVNDRASATGIMDGIAALAQVVGAEDRVLFYFAGHGMAEDSDDGPRGYVIPSDANRNARSFIAMSTLHDALTSLGCNHFLAILDCCFAGAFRWSGTRALTTVPEVLHQERYERYLRDAAWQVLASAAHDQRALDIVDGNILGERREVKGHSPFALALLAGLEGAADLVPKGTANGPGGDGVITATELYLYLREELDSGVLTPGRQTPSLWPLRKHDKGEYIFLVPGRRPDLPSAPELTNASNPYRGLKSFAEKDEDLFFGRDEVISELERTVVDRTLTIVVAASGTGKTSLVQAGVLPRLRRDLGRWRVVSPGIGRPMMRPGDRPLRTLAVELSQAELPGAAPRVDALYDDLRRDSQALATWLGRWREAYSPLLPLILIDQLEELITMCKDDHERDQFLLLFANAVLEHGPELRIVSTLRSDFEPQLTRSALQPYWTASRFVLREMTRRELRAAVEGPAFARVLFFQPWDLVERIIDEVVHAPGALPLLSFTLRELYQRMLERGSERALREDDYTELGGVVGSLRSKANQLWDSLDDHGRLTMRRMILRMVSLEGGEVARRRVPRAELDYPDEDENRRVAGLMERLVADRLLVEGTTLEAVPYVEPAHEELIRGWDRLWSWIRRDHESILLRARLRDAAAEWGDVTRVRTGSSERPVR